MPRSWPGLRSGMEVIDPLAAANANAAFDASIKIG
jgi:hypothetical protein